MSKLTRVFQKQFGVNAGNSDVGIFGSLAASNPQYSKDPETIQSLNAFLTGWAAETIANNRPALEDFNAIDFLTFYQLCYLLQTGVAEWNAETTYYIGSIVNDGTGVLYKSLANDNIDNDPTTEADKWEEVIPNPTTGGVAGSYKNLKVVRASKTQVTVTADELVLENTDHEKVSVFGVNQSAAITSSGAGGLDTGSEANVWYYIWIIRKSSDGTLNALLSASATAPTLPEGYDQKALVSAVHNTSGDFVDFIQEGDEYSYPLGLQLATGTNLSWTAIDLTTFVPSALSTIARGTVRYDCSTSSCYVSNVNTEYVGLNAGESETGTNKVGGYSVGGGIVFWEYPILTANTIYYVSTGTTGFVYCSGFKLNKI